MLMMQKTRMKQRGNQMIWMRMKRVMMRVGVVSMDVT
jgi:hypothetical protein